MTSEFPDKESARQAVWDRLWAEGLARFPFPPHGRIPNFKDSAQAAKRLFDVPTWRDARKIKVNPDAPQRYVRIEALKRGIEVFVPTPRLRAGFTVLDPKTIPYEELPAAAAISSGRKWAREVQLPDVPQMDAIVAGSVAVTRDGRRAGKGEGYSDMEYAILRELGHAHIPVATTVHPVQIVGAFPIESNDIPLSCIVTPNETLSVAAPPPAPDSIDWERLSEEDLDQMPILRELKNLRRDRR